jgi:hypothetical protein
MRFSKETRALIHEARPNPVTIPWPAGEREPQKGRVYWLQSEEDAKEAAKKAEVLREHFPETCAEVLAGMHRRHYGTEPNGKRKRRRPKPISRPKAGDDRILVIDTTILDKGWEAKVAIYEDPDPIQHLRVAASVPAGPNPIEGYHELAETEPEQIKTPSSHELRREQEEALTIEHKGSIDKQEILKAERKLADQRRKGKNSKLAREAVDRAKRRALVSAETFV